MAKAPGDPRNPLFESRIPMPGKIRSIPRPQFQHMGNATITKDAHLPVIKPNPKSLKANTFLIGGPPTVHQTQTKLNQSHETDTEIISGSLKMVDKCNLNETVNSICLSHDDVKSSTFITDEPNDNYGSDSSANIFNASGSPNKKTDANTVLSSASSESKVTVEETNPKYMQLNETYHLNSKDDVSNTVNTIRLKLEQAKAKLYNGNLVHDKQTNKNSTFILEEESESGPFSFLMGINEIDNTRDLPNANTDLISFNSPKEVKRKVLDSSYTISEIGEINNVTKTKSRHSIISTTGEDICESSPCDTDLLQATSTPTDPLPKNHVTKTIRAPIRESLGLLSPSVFNRSINLVSDAVLWSPKDSANKEPTPAVDSEKTTSTESPFEMINNTVKDAASCDTGTATSAAIRPFILGPMTRLPYNRFPLMNQKPVSPLTVPSKSPVICSNPFSSSTTSSVSSPFNVSFSQQNSFEGDESLGILTPDQMESMFTNTPPRELSCDDLRSFISSSKRSDKTLSVHSRTPSSENIKSITPDSGNDIRPLKEVKANKMSSPEVVNNSQLIDKPGKVPEQFDQTLTSQNGNISVSDFKESDFTLNWSYNPESIVVLSNSAMDDDLLASLHSSILDPVSSVVDTTMNLDLPLDPILLEGVLVDRKQYALQQAISRIDQTPSPEDLPLDPVGVKTDVSENDLVEMAVRAAYNEQSHTDSDSKNELTKSAISKVSSSFITSITSITSLDTGYQGDGEMSRPASRGADHSPSIGHRGNEQPALQNQWQQQPINRRQDPMTDSDFFTESDADNHEDLVQRGDRRAQVIDGQLYGRLNGLANANNLFINQPQAEDSCMESSGIFTDLENRGDERSTPPLPADLSPDVSSKTISSKSDCSQKNIDANITTNNSTQDLNDTNSGTVKNNVNTSALSNANDNSFKSSTKSGNEKSQTEESYNSSKTLQKSPNNSPRKVKEVDQLKKHKMPNRNVTSKVKTRVSPSRRIDDENQENRRPTLKKNNKWDPVMNKIAENKATNLKPKLAEVKSKIVTGIAVSEKPKIPRKNDEIKTRVGLLGPSNSSRMLNPPLKCKSRRNRVRASESNLASSKDSQHSSQSDLSVGMTGVSTIKTTTKHVPLANRGTKKRDITQRTTSPLSDTITNPRQPTPPRLTRPTTLQKRGLSSATTSTNIVSSLDDPKVPRKVTPRRANISTVQPKPAPLKDHNRLVSQQPGNGGIKTSGVVSSPLRSPHASSDINKTVVPVAPVPVVPQPVVDHRALLTPHLTHSAKSVEALGVLVQYLVFNLDAFATPQLKREIKITKKKLLDEKLYLDEARAACRRLDDQVKDREAEYLAKERALSKAHGEEIEKIQKCLTEVELANTERISILKNEFAAKEIENLATIKELTESQKILKTDYASIKENYDEIKASEIEFSEKLKLSQIKEQECNKKLMVTHREYECFKVESAKREQILKDKLILLQEELNSLRQTKVNNSASRDKHTTSPLRSHALQDEVESLRNVLELKQGELSELRKQTLEYQRAAGELPLALMKIQNLETKVEDLEVQLQRKIDGEKDLCQKNKILQESYHQETQQKIRLSQHNEELKWKLKQNLEVTNVLASYTTSNASPRKISLLNSADEPVIGNCSPGNFVRSCSQNNSTGRSPYTSFNEKYSYSASMIDKSALKLERKHSFRESDRYKYSKSLQSSFSGFDRQLPDENKSDHDSSNNSDKSRSLDCFEMDDLSPPTSPKIKAVVEKNDSVSWVLEINESPEYVASRIVRRAGSFRNTTPPPSSLRVSSNFNGKSTQSPVPKRQRCGNNALIQSASSSAIIRENTIDRPKDLRLRSKSVSIKNTDLPGALAPSNSAGLDGNKESCIMEFCSSTPNPKRSAAELSSPDQFDDFYLRDRAASFSYTTQETAALRRDRASSFKHNRENRSLITCDTAALTSDRAELCPTLPSHPSSNDLGKLQLPKGAVARDLVFGSNSEDESHSCSSDDQSQSESESSDGKKISKEDKEQMLDSFAANFSGTPMEVSWCDDTDVTDGMTESDM